MKCKFIPEEGDFVFFTLSNQTLRIKRSVSFPGWHDYLVIDNHIGNTYLIDPRELSWDACRGYFKCEGLKPKDLESLKS